jgi:hypothetical protein
MFFMMSPWFWVYYDVQHFLLWCRTYSFFDVIIRCFFNCFRILFFFNIRVFGTHRYWCPLVLSTMLQSQPPPNTVQRNSQDAEGLGEVGIGEGQVGNSARTEGTTEREGTDGTTRVTGRRWAPEDSCGGVSRRGRLWLPAEGLRETLVGLQYKDP